MVLVAELVLALALDVRKRLPSGALIGRVLGRHHLTPSRLSAKCGVSCPRSLVQILRVLTNTIYSDAVHHGSLLVALRFLPQLLLHIDTYYLKSFLPSSSLIINS